MAARDNQQFETTLVVMLLALVGLTGVVLAYLGMFPIAITVGLVVMGAAIYAWRHAHSKAVVACLLLVGTPPLGVGILGYYFVL